MKLPILLAIFFIIFCVFSCSSLNQSSTEKPLIVAEINSASTKTDSPQTSPQLPPTTTSTLQNVTTPTAPSEELAQTCIDQLKEAGGIYDENKIAQVCKQIAQKDGCKSVKDRPIYHFDRIANDDKSNTKILAIGLVHGDELPSVAAIRSWMERLLKISPRNSWRLIPIMNPDGLYLKTRTNANGVDLNRNFPSLNWEKEAIEYWEKEAKKNPRRFPGTGPASEPETKCIMEHINDFKPDLVIAIHTPLGILDYDGPKVKYPKYTFLPWKALGHHPGSLGRFMWRDHETPVLTIELRGNSAIKDLKTLDKPQDISGILSLMTTNKMPDELQDD